MKLNIYAIYDTCSGLYSRPIFDNADAAAKRQFGDLAIAADHPVGQHPDHYSIHRLGVYDDMTGTFINEENECLITGLESVSLQKNVNQAAQMDLVEEIAKGNGEHEIPTSI